MKRIVRYWVLLALLLTSVAANAQNFAGPNVKILRIPGHGSTWNLATAKIGVADDGYCYTWGIDQMYIVSPDHHAGVIEICPQQDTTLINVSRVTLNGVEEDRVMVIVLDSIRIVSVTPKVECYNNGDEIKKEDFKIVTSPKGYEDLVTFTPTIAKNQFIDWNHETKTIQFSVESNGHVSTKYVDVDVYNNSSELNISSSVDPTKLPHTWKQMKHKWELVKESLEITQKVSKQLQKVKVPTPMRVVPIVEMNIELPTPHSFEKCCNGKAKEGIEVKVAPITARAGLEGHIVFGGAPGLIELGANLGIVGFVRISPFSFYLLDDDECVSPIFPITVGAEIWGGMEFSVLDGGAVDARLEAFGNASVTVDFYNTVKNNQGISMDVNLGVRAEVLLGDFFTESFSMILYSDRLVVL